MQNEEWVQIVGYEGLYEVNRNGEIKSVERKYIFPKTAVKVKETILKQRIDRGGYYTVVLHKGGKSCTRYVHRLIGTAYINNPFKKPYINHINGNKLDNSLENLEWVSASENMKHAIRNNLSKIPVPFKRRVIDTCQGKEYSSIKEASNTLNISYKRLTKMLSGEIINKTCLQLAA
jgi:hypothetical protein